MTYFLKCFFLLLFGFLFSPEPDAAEKAVPMAQASGVQQLTGRTAARYGATAAGASVYTMPIEVPPGINKTSPHLQLSYSSTGQVQELGVGWDLSGPGTITRCSAIPAVDGYRGSIQYTQKDRFCIGGQRLIKVGNTGNGNNADYTAAGSIYRTELDTWRLFTASSNSCGIGPCSFTVNSPDGSILEFGSKTDSQTLQTNGNSVRSWAVSRATDRNGNIISYTYTESPVAGLSFAGDGRVYLKSISYGANAAAQAADNRRVDFEYEARPDAGYAFVGGGQVVTQARLTKVVSSVAAASRSYQISYGLSSAATKRSLVRSVTECLTTSTGTACKPPNEFTWQEAAITVEMSNLSLLLATTNKAIFPGDLNADGRGDLLQVTQSGNTALFDPYISDGTDLIACGTKTSASATSSTIFLPMDVNGDGRLDLVTSDINSSRLTFAPWIMGTQGCQMTRANLSQGPPNGKPDYQWPMDVNGDGKTDLVAAWENSSSQVITLVSFVSTGTQLHQGQISQFPIAAGKTTYWPMDVNADGMVDLAFGKVSGSSLIISAAISNQGAFTLSNSGSMTINNSLTIGFWPLDVNGDGNVDLIQGWQSGGRLSLTTFQANGAGSFAAGQTLTTGVNPANQLGIWSMDIIGDGSTDLVLATKTSGTIALNVFLAAGNGLAQAQSLGSSLTSDNYDTVWPLDLNGDGRVDLVQGQTNGASMSFKSWVAKGGKPDLLSTAVDGYGRRVAFNYLPMSDTAVYMPASARPTGSNNAAGLGFGYRLTPAAGPFQPVTGSVMHLVSTVTENVDPAINPLGYQYTTQWSYSDALIDLSGRGWLGFGQVASTKLNDGLKTINTYAQAFPETGTIIQTETQCVATKEIKNPDPNCPSGSTGTTLSKSTSKYDSQQTVTGLTQNTPKVFQVLLNDLKMDSYTYGAYDHSRDKGYKHDFFGNVTQLTQTGKYDQRAPKPSTLGATYSCARYTDDPDRVWRFGLVANAKVSTDETSCSDFDQANYDSIHDLQLSMLTFTNDKRTNLATKSGWDDINKLWLTDAFGYDAFGNAVSITGPGVPPTTTRFDGVYNTFKAQTNFPEGLSQHYSFDPLTGILVGMQQQNGAISITCLDPLARLEKTQSLPPAGSSASDANCIPLNATGDRRTFAAAKVATTRTVTLSSSTQDGIRHHVAQLQNWEDQGDILNTTALLDGRGRSRIVMTSSANPAKTRFTCTEFDEDDQTVGASVPNFTAASLPDCGPVRAGSWVVTTFDAYQRLAASSSPDSAGAATTTEYAWPGSLAMTMSQASNSAAPYIRDIAFDWFNGSRKPVSMTVRGTSMRSSFEWDGLGRITRTVDPATPSSPQGVATQINHDSLGRKTTVFNPDMTNPVTEANPAWNGSYDPMTGNLSTIADASGQVRKLDYDDLGRMVSRILSDGSQTTWTYDGPGFGNGRVWTVTGLDPNGTTLYKLTYGYDAAGNVTAKTTDFQADNLSYTMQFAYDPLKRLRKVTWPDGSFYDRAYIDDNLISVSLQNTDLATWSNHTALGSPRNAAYANGANSDWSYAPTGQILTTLIKDKSGAAAINSQLAWDPLWNLQAIDDKAMTGGVDRSQNFSYQNLRLISAQAPGLYGSLNYGYDDSGNVVQQGGATFSYRAHQVLQGIDSGTINYAADYDGNGNVSTRTIGASRWTFSYDPLNRLIRVEEAGVTTLQVPIYDPSGTRLKKIDPASAQTWYVSPYLRVTEKGGVWNYTRLIRSDDGLVASVTADGNGQSAGSAPTTLFVHQDYLNSTTLTTDEAGTVEAVLAYVPWGAPSAIGSSGSGSVREKFQGRELDSVTSGNENGIYYFGARYYDPAVGRFLSPDNQLGSQLLRQDAQNRFAFALNNPVTVIDPTGHFSISAIIGAIADAGLVIAGAIVDVLSEGVLEPVGGALIGSGLNGLQYSVTHGNNFSWAQFGIQNGTGAVLGAATGGFGALADAGEAGATAAVGEAEDLTAGAAVNASEDSMSDASEALSTDESGSAADEGDATSEEDDTGSCEGNSFPGGTLVLTSVGKQAIEILQTGDSVVGLNQHNPVLGSQLVGKTYLSDAKELVALTLTDGVVTETISATPAHPFWVRHIGWLDAEKVTENHQIFSGNGVWLDVVGAEIIAYGGSVYNFTVSEAHTYFVGKLQAWVHNPKGAGLCDIGGRHYENTKQVERKLVESNHFPASAAYEGTPYANAPFGWRPAVNMDYVDHLETESWGSSASAAAWRAKQTALMKAGKFADAMAMDIEDMKGITAASTGDRHYLQSGMEEAVEFAANPNPHLGGNPFISKAEKTALLKLIRK